MTDPAGIAEALDRDDPLAGFRDRFDVDDDLAYLDGNSLGRPPRTVAGAVDDAVRHWTRELVGGWDRWLTLGTEIGDLLAPIVGARDGEVALGDQTTVNLYKLAVAALRLTGRPSILTDAGNFPSDRYVLASVAADAGGRLIVAPEDASPATLGSHLDDTVGLVSLSHVAYRSAHLHDGPAVTEVARRNGSLTLWDLSHAAGSVPVDLDAWGADLAVGCTYKYLNGGPGAPAFLYVRSDLHERLDQPITGWFGHADQFAFEPDYRPAPSIERFLVGTPPILSMVAAREGIAVTAEAGIDPIRAKGVAMSELFVSALGPVVDAGAIDIASPLDADRRGSHVALRHPDALRISAALRDRGVIVDHRAPDLVRFGFAPVYVTYREVAHAARELTSVLADRSYEALPAERTGVT